MDNTTFKNANGLTAEGHLSTARDMNVLGRHLFFDFPQYYNIFSRRTADAGVATVTNTNSRFLDGYEGADGIKTGYTSAAGFNLTASARRGDKHIIATVFGGTSTVNRNAKMTELMDLGFGEARNNVTEEPPVAAPLPDDALIASLETGIDEIDAEGGAGKTIRVSGEVTRSLRPKPRPVLPAVSDEVAIAMAAGIDGALAEATAEPAPEGTLEFQADVMTAGTLPAETPLVVAEDTALAAAEVADADVPEATLLAAADLPAEVAAPDPQPGTLEAQVAALAENQPEAGTALAALPTEEASTLPGDGEPDLASTKPKARPETVAESVPEIAPEIALAVVSPEPELVVTDPGPALTEVAALTPLLAEITDVETVAGDMNAGVPAVEIAAATVTAPAPKRAAPIFEAVEVAEAPTEAEPEVVVVMSTSGGRHFGVNVGEYPSRYEAERALLKTALAESATLNEGLRKTSQSDGSWRASFMGLTEEQAELACRRLSARAIPCETVGG
jgi:D-alanyl-D-alanine carboxypeptidase